MGDREYMGLVLGKWQIKQRQEPIGGLAFRFVVHLGSTGGQLVLAVMLTIFIPFCRIAIRIEERLIQGDEMNCFGSSCSGSGAIWAWVTFTFLLVLLLGLTLWKSRSFRNFVLQFLIPFFGLIAAATLSAAVAQNTAAPASSKPMVIDAAVVDNSYSLYEGDVVKVDKKTFR